MADVLQTLAAAPTPATDPMGSEARKAQYRIAELLSQQGMDTSPISSPWQGLARMAQAGFGGWDRSLLDKEEKAQDRAFREIQARDPRLATGDTPSPQDRVATALAGGPTVANTAATYGAVPKMGAGPSDVTSRIITNESGGNPYATNPRSSAAGSGQFIDSTWLDMINKNRPDLAQGKSEADILAMRNDPSLSRDMTAAYAKNNQDTLTGAGLPATPGSTYLAHFAGPQGAINIMRADPRTPVGSVLGDQVVRANPFLANMTAGDLIGWANRKMAGATPAAGGAPPVPGNDAPITPTPVQTVAFRPPGPEAGAPAATPGVPQAAAPQPGMASPQAAAAAPAVPGASGAQPAQMNRVPTQMTPEIAQYILQLRAMRNNPAAQAQAEALTQQYSKPTEYDFKVVGDKLVRTDKLGNHTIVGDAGKPPNAVQEADDALKNWQKYNFPDPQSTDPKAQQFWRQLLGNRLSGVSTMIDQRAPDAFETHYGEGMAKQALATIDAGNTASLQGQKIQLAQRMLQDIQTGKITPTTSTVGAWMQAFGVDPARFGINPSTPMTAEALTGLTNDMVIGKIGAGGMPANNFSDADRKFLERTSTSLSDRPEANFIKLEMARRVNELQAQKANAWADARDGGLSYEKFERQWRKDTQQKDIFGDLIEQAKAFGAQPGQQGGPVDQTKMREGVQSVVGSDEYKAAVEAAKKRGWKIPGVTP